MMLADKSYPCVSIHVPTPDGTMTVNFIEDHDGNLIDVHIFIGKTGASLAAWTNGMSLLLRQLLEVGKDITEILVSLSNITTHRIVYTESSKAPIRSGVDGLAYAIMRYNEDRRTRTKLEEGEDREIFRYGF